MCVCSDAPSRCALSLLPRRPSPLPVPYPFCPSSPALHPVTLKALPFPPPVPDPPRPPHLQQQLSIPTALQAQLLPVPSEGDVAANAAHPPTHEGGGRGSEEGMTWQPTPPTHLHMRGGGEGGHDVPPTLLYIEWGPCIPACPATTPTYT